MTFKDTRTLHTLISIHFLLYLCIINLSNIMKLKITKVILAVILCISAIYFYKVERDIFISDLAFQNIEALAQREDTENYYCFGDGSVECDGRQVEYKIGGLR